MNHYSEQAASPDEQHIQDQAEYWVVRLASETVSPDEKATFALWLQASPQHQSAYEEAMILMQEMELACDALYTTDVTSEGQAMQPSLEQEIESLVQEQQAPGLMTGQSADPANIILLEDTTKTKPGRRYAGLSFFSVALILLLTSVLYMMPSWDHLSADYSTEFAQTRQILLDDGTRITLNSNSSVSVDFTPQRRQVYLSGEAFFQVQPDPQRPYIVTTDHGQTRVLGTSFNVNTREESTRVDVIEGVVEVENRGGQQQTLTQGEYQRFDQHFITDQNRQELQRIQDWQQGLLVIQNQPLESVLEQLNQNYSGHLLVLDKYLLKQSVSGVFTLTDRALAIEVLTASLRLKHHQMAGVTLLYQ